MDAPDSRETAARKKAEKEIENSLAKAGKAVKRGDFAGAMPIYRELARLAESASDRRAVDFCVEEAKCSQKLGNDFNAGWGYKCAAVYALAFNELDAAVNFAAKAMEFFLKADSMYAVQWCYNLIGQAGERKGDYDLAMKNYAKSLEIGYSEEIDRRVKSLADLVPSVAVEHRCGKEAANEGEKVNVLLTVRNDTRETMREMKVLGWKSNVLESIPALKPGESKTFEYSMAAFEDARSPFHELAWTDPRGGKGVRTIGPPVMCVIPGIEAMPYLRGRPSAGKKSFFVLSVSNNSRQRIRDVEIDLKFPVEMKVHPVTGYSIDSIGPGEEAGFVFKILPTAPGRTVLKPAISFQDVRGRRFVKKSEPFILEESPDFPGHTGRDETAKVDKNDFERVKCTEKFKRYLESFVRPKEIGESDYVKLASGMRSATKGYTLKGVGIDAVAGHVKEECRSFALVSEHDADGRLLMFSGESSEGAFLLTVAMKEERDDIVHVAFMLYSDAEEDIEDIAGKIADISEYTIIAMSLATEIQKIEVNETINIIDSIVQRTKIGERARKKDKNVEIKDSIVQGADM